MAPHEELDTHHKCLGTHKQSTPRAGEGLPAGAARLGRAALQSHLFEQAAGCGMNVQRAQRLQAIEDACAREDGGVKSFSGQRSLPLRPTSNLLLTTPSPAPTLTDGEAATADQEVRACSQGRGL